MKKCYPEFNWTIVEVTVLDDEKHQRSYRLILNGGKKTRDFVELMRTRFYSGKLKKIPDEILNNTILIQQAFYDGYYAGDGFRWLKKNKNAEGFDILGQIGAQGLCYLVERLGYSTSVREKKGKPNVFTIFASKRYRRMYPGEVFRIYETEYSNRFVYDIETESHTLNTGVGGLVLHNCDGIHISGLIQNLFHSLFPTLFERENPFVVSMQTPVVKVTPAKGQQLIFYDESKYKAYANEFAKKNPHKTINKKYYKGLGANSKAEVKDIFGKKIVEFVKDEHADANMIKLFHKSQADARKKWMANYNPNKRVDWDSGDVINQMNMSDFIDYELVKFSIDDCGRSIPGLMDGNKESHRKVLYSVFLRNLSYKGKSLKTAQLAGYVAEKSGYHHGEMNLFDTITRMANDYVGSNNIPLLYRDGQFGSRLAGGKDAANARYTSTKMDVLTRLIYRPEDEELLPRNEDDGDVVEPQYYVPIIPMMLVNGCTCGIGTGWSSNIPCYNPKDLIVCLREWIETGEIKTDIHPWYRGFTGKIEADGTNYVSYGRVETGARGLKIVSELPVGMWTNNFKDFLDDLKEGKKIKDYKNNSTTDKVIFTITENGMTCDLKSLKLSTNIKLSNMVMFDENHVIKKYNTVKDILNNYCSVRYDYYVKRKSALVKDKKELVKFLGNKRRFLEEIMSGELKLFGEEQSSDPSGAKRPSGKKSRPSEDIVADLEEREYDKVFGGKDTEEDEKVGGKKSGYEYLLRMQFRSITEENINKLKNEVASEKKALKEILATTEKAMWLNDLEEFETAYDGVYGKSV